MYDYDFDTMFLDLVEVHVEFHKDGNLDKFCEKLDSVRENWDACGVTVVMEWDNLIRAALLASRNVH